VATDRVFNKLRRNAFDRLKGCSKPPAESENYFFSQHKEHSLSLSVAWSGFLFSTQNVLRKIEILCQFQKNDVDR
jgi:hypothetical protein